MNFIVMDSRFYTGKTRFLNKLCNKINFKFYVNRFKIFT